MREIESESRRSKERDSNGHSSEIKSARYRESDRVREKARERESDKEREGRRNRDSETER